MCQGLAVKSRHLSEFVCSIVMFPCPSRQRPTLLSGNLLCLGILYRKGYHCFVNGYFLCVCLCVLAFAFFPWLITFPLFSLLILYLLSSTIY